MTLVVLRKTPPGTAGAGDEEAAKPKPVPDALSEKQTPAQVSFRTATVTRGDIEAKVSATGTIEPEEVVNVAAKVAGQIVSLGDDPRGATDPHYKGKSIDFGSPVEKDTILARLDDAIYRARLDQAKAAYERAKSELNLAREFQRMRGKQEPSKAAGSVASAEAAIRQHEAALTEAQINLDNTIIKLPIKGVILTRRVNVGQNVGPDPKAPSLFLIAKDPTKLQVWASINANHVDISPIHEGMEARFTVQDLPKEVFKGKVAQIRPNATRTQDEARYTVVVTFDNSDLKLRPYMTANLQFVIGPRSVLRVPNAALNWSPRPDQVASEARESAEMPFAGFPRGRLWVKDRDGQHVRFLEVEQGWPDAVTGMYEVSGPEVKEGMEVIVGEGPSAAAAGKQPAVTPLTTGTPAVSPAAELKAVQGKWKVVSVEKGNGSDSTGTEVFAGRSMLEARGRAGRGARGSRGSRGLADYGTFRSLDRAILDRFDFSEVFGTGTALELEVLRIAWFNPITIPSEGRRSFTYRLDPAASPKTIDLLDPVLDSRAAFGGAPRGGAAAPSAQGVTGEEQLAALGIYEILGNRMRICLARYHSSVAGNQRPASFSADPASGAVLFVLERDRPSADGIADKTAIEDYWNVAAEIEDGKAVPEEKLLDRWCSFGDLAVGISDKTADGFSQEVLYGQYFLDAAKQPKTIKITTYLDPETEKPQKREYLGIYKLEGDRLQIAYRQGGPAPEKFESLPGSGVTLLVLQRPRPEQPKAAERATPAPGGAKTGPSRNGGAPADAASSGSGKTGSANPPKDLDSPEGVVFRFLDAVRKGNDRQSAAMLSELARKGYKELKIPALPPPSGTTRFEIGRVEYPGKDLARVAAKWIDVVERGHEHSDQMTWTLRKEAEGWRIVGLAATVFQGEPPLMLDFESPAKVLETLDVMRREVARTMQQPAAGPKPPAKPAAEKAPAAPAEPGTR